MPSTSSSSVIPASDVSARALWGGRIVTAIAVLFLTFDMAIKLLRLPVAVEATMQLGYPEVAVRTIGIIEAVCLGLYLWPKTALLGAVLWVGYLGGAIATHLRVGSPRLSHTLFPIYIAALLWLGLWLRSVRVRHVVRAAFRTG
jgi:hypothetical protein